ncbi:MAG: hypothetical protein LH477_11920, partial [Nocardioides sp.]|nr:hypothetical protein [Nocardioides sp.]
MRLSTSPGQRQIAGALAAASAVALAGSMLAGAPASAVAARVTTFAPAATATITPGTQMYTDGAQCTANFVYADASGNVYVGYAAHCAGDGGAATDTNGCLATSLPLGTKVTFNEGGSLLSDGTELGSGTLAYSSWLTQSQIGTTDPNTCAYNDLALVKVDADDAAKVNPSVPFWGGPSGIDTDGTAAGDRVYSYGNSSLRAGVTALSPRTGARRGAAAAARGGSPPRNTHTPRGPRAAR